MLPDFRDIVYLLNGSKLQQKAFHALTSKKILYHLLPFDGILTGTMPLDLFVEGKSDLDIICCSNAFESVEKVLLSNFSNESSFDLKIKSVHDVPTLLCHFLVESFPVEIFCQNKPVEAQLAYRHMLVEYKLLQKNGLSFKRQILELKSQGMKTEPAFAQLLQLTGDPYEAILELETSKA